MHLDPDFNMNIADRCCIYTVDEFNSKFKNYPSNYSLYNHNLQSFHAKFSGFQAFLDVIDHKFHTIVVTETWNTPNNVNLCNLDNYSAVHTFRKPSPSLRGGPGGGVSIFSDNILYKMNKIEELSVCNDTIETCVAEILCIDDPTQNHIIVAVYRPHSDSIENFTVQLNQILTHRDLFNKNVIIAGDMNADISVPNSVAINDYLNTLSSLHFIPVITKPTRYVFSNSYMTSTTLDHIFINKLSIFHSAVFSYDLSDHLGTAIIFDALQSEVEKNYSFTFRPYSESNLSNLESKLIDTNWDNILISDDVNSQFDNFFVFLDQLYCECFPIVNKQVSAKRRSNPWVSNETRQKIRQKSIYYHLMKNGFISKAENNRFKNRLNKEIQRDKHRYYQNLFNDAKQNMKKSWKNLNSLLGNKTQGKIDILHGVNSYDDQVRVLNKFNTFFATIGSNLAANFSNNSQVQLTDNIPRLNNSFYFLPTTENEILEIIANLKNTKTNLNSFPISLFKIVAPILARPLNILIENSFQSGIFPEQLKIAKITPLHKSGDTSNPSNFRPISSLPYISKIYEKLMAKRILSFCQKFSIISPNQFGFQPGVSTCDALVELIESIYQSLNEKNHHVIALIDIKKAFDSVNHRRLLTKLESYGIRGFALRWLQSYLENRKCFIAINNLKSDVLTFNVGVPQGSVLGPILFLLMINDLPRISDNIQTVLFADDTTISTSRSDFSELVQLSNNELKNVSDWTNFNQLTLNADKTELMIITLRPIDENFVFEFNNEVITPTNHCRFLGVMLDHKLTFKSHIDLVSNKISRHSGILYKIKHLLPLATRLNYYFAFIFPYLSYNVIVWGGTYKSHLNPLIISHKKIIRNICDAEYLEHSSPLYKKLGLLKFEDIYRYKLLIYMFKARCNGLYLIEHERTTRNRDQSAYSNFHRLELTQHAVSFAGPKLWNSLPINLRNIESLGQFKRSLQKYFIDSY